MTQIVARADGSEDSSVELSDDGEVVIRRNGFFAKARQGPLVELRVGELSEVALTLPRFGIKGIFELVPVGQRPRGGFAANNTNPNAVYFDGAQLPSFERLRAAILAQMDRGGLPPTHWAPTARPVLLVLTSRPRQPHVVDLNVDLEEREILEELQRVPFGDQLELRLRPAASADSLLNDLLENKPTALHFSGHGLVEGIVVEGPGRSAVLASEAALARLCALDEIAKNLTLVVLNACLTSQQAAALATRVPAVIGTLASVGDAAAISFAKGFYNAIGRGLSVASAFAAGVASVSLNSGEGEAQKYVCFRRDDVDLSTLAIAGHL